MTLYKSPLVKFGTDSGIVEPPVYTVEYRGVEVKVKATVPVKVGGQIVIDKATGDAYRVQGFIGEVPFGTNLVNGESDFLYQYNLVLVDDENIVEALSMSYDGFVERVGNELAELALHHDIEFDATYRYIVDIVDAMAVLHEKESADVKAELFDKFALIFHD